MLISFKLDGPYAVWIAQLYAFTVSARGPQFASASDLCKSLIEAMLDDDARDNRDTAFPN